MSAVRVSRNLAASIRQRLLDRGRARGEDFQLLLDRYAVERLLYRLSISGDAEKQRQWNAFVARNRLNAPALDAVVEALAIFVEEPLALAARTKRRDGA